MALINCPECGKEISDKSKQCIHCGFPLESYVSNSGIYDMVLKTISASPKKSLASDFLEDVFEIKKGRGRTLLSTQGNIILQGIEVESMEYLKHSFGQLGYEMDFVPSDSDYINPINTKITELDKRWRERQKKAIKCPTCGSTNTQKISATSKVIGAATFGLLSKTARSQFKCNHCGYKW